MGGVVFSTLLWDLEGWKEDRLDDGNDVAVSTVAVFGGASIGGGVGAGRSCSTKEGSVIVDGFCDVCEFPSKVWPKSAAFVPKDIGELRGERWEGVSSDALNVGA